MPSTPRLEPGDAPSLAVAAPIAGLSRPDGSLAALLQRAAAESRAGMVFVQADDSERRHGYDELLVLATRRLAGLRAAGFQAGDLAPIVTAQGFDFVVTFWACMLGGIVAVPLTYPTSFSVENHALAKIAEVARQIGAWRVLGDRMLATRLAEAASLVDVAGLAVLDVAGLDGHGDAAEPTPGCGDALALIQYSSGSTGSPKGVALSHRNLLTNVEACATAIGMRPQDTVLSWMPFSHDMGLIGLHLTPVFGLANQVNLNPGAFVRRPQLWLDKLAEHRAAFTGSPNFGYRLVLERLAEGEAARWDLSGVRAIFNGAEPISVSLAREFVDALAAARLAPSAMYTVYGMAEACVAVAFPPIGEVPVVRHADRRALAEEGRLRLVEAGHADAMAIADEGVPVPSCALRIVGERGEVLPEGQVGQVQIRGDNVTRGYYRNPQANAEAFDGDWLRTGDLGFMAGGRLSITGRSKDVVIVNGQKYFAYDIEACAEEAEGVRSGKAVVCGWHDEQERRERVVMFVAVRPPRGGAGALKELLSALWRRINSRFSIALDQVVVVKQVPRTTSGKLQRYQLREAYLAGEFAGSSFDAAELLAAALPAEPRPAATAGAPADATAGATAGATAAAAATPARPPAALPSGALLRERLLECWGQVLQRAPASIPCDVSFLDLGGSSIKAVQLLGRVEQALSVRLDHEFLLQCRTVDDMVAWLSRRPGAEAAPAARGPAAAAGDEIAIIGMACRFPQADTPEAFWEALAAGRDCITEVPAERWNVDRHYRPGAPAAGRTNSRWGGFIDGAYRFDAAFFGIPPSEAAVMDPQQRLFLQVCHEALERAGRAGAASRGRAVGVFAGASHVNHLEHHLHGLDWARFQQFDSYAALDGAQRDALAAEWKRRFGDPGHEPNTAVDNLLNMVAARVAHVLNLKGPALAVDTACSSSLVAVHLACESLRRGECEMALAGGVNLNLSPTPYLLFSRAGALSPDGRCKVFDADADGFVPGEGVGAVLLKPLARALADGDTVHAVIRRSVVNNDGRSLGPMAPNPDGQRLAIAAAYGDGRLDPRGVQYVEAHGTGTAIGDPSELRALAPVFEGGHAVIGSVKANIGHLLAAAGIASLIKLVLAMQHRRMPPSLHVKRPNALLGGADSPFALLHEAADWPAPATGSRRGAINSFGFGGTNCHLVLDEAPAPAPASADEPPQHLLCLSAPDDERLREQAQALAAHLSAQAGLSPADVCHSLRAGRSHRSRRLAVVADGLAGLVAGLADAAPVAVQQPPRLALMFTGQGSQHPGMTRRLYEGWPAFRRAIDDCADAFAPHLPVPLTDWLYGAAGDEATLARTRVTQPVVFAVDHALGRMLLDWGLQPECLLGHSVGEYAAACLAGVMSLDDAARLVAARGRLIDALPPGGGMLAVFDSEARVRPLLAGFEGRVWFAAHNGSQQVVSGERAALAELQVQCTARGIVCRSLPVSHAFHTPLLAPMREAFASELATVRFAAPRWPVIANAGARWIAGEPMDAAHWLDHLGAPVCFEQSVRLAAERGVIRFVECGPDRVLSSLARAALGPGAAPALSALDRRRDDWQCLMTLAARLYEAGVDLDPEALAMGRAPRRVVLPASPCRAELHRIATDDRFDTPATAASVAAAALAPASGATPAAPVADLRPAPLATAEGRPGAATALPESGPLPAPVQAAGVPAQAAPAGWPEVVRHLVAEATGGAPERVDMRVEFHALGLDSAAAVRLAERLSAIVGSRLAPTLLFEHQSPAALVEHLMTLGPPAGAPPQAVEPPAPRPARPAGADGAFRVAGPVASPLPDPAGPGAPREQDIAIVGMACRLPGADTLDQYWQLLVEGRSQIREVRDDQWSVADYFRTGPQASHTSYSKWGAFIERPHDFDPLFFGISPREAEVMDPQQRLFLQVAWEALQQSGHGGEFRGHEVGVFVGCELNHYGEHFIMNQRYQALARRVEAMPWVAALPPAQRGELARTLRDVMQPATLIPDAVAGQGLNEIAARVSHWLDLRGPALAVNTACSSSLVALHLACASLRAGETRMAIVGGAYLAGNDSSFVFLSRLGALSPSGRCAPFDARADGLVLGEGVSALVLKPLKDALRDGDHVHAVIKGSAVNNDGHSNGITAPNPRGQAEAIRKAYADAGVGPETVGYVECHGTGTPVGDPVEIEGLTQAFRSFGERAGRCAIGSVKSSIGHMLSGSTLPGLIKVVLALQHRQIPPTHGYETPSPHIDFEASPFAVVAGRAQPWLPCGDAPLRAGINSFGFGGTNCHVVIEEAPRLPSPAHPASDQLLLLAGRTPAVLQQVAGGLRDALAEHPQHAPAEVCWSLNGAQRDLAFKAALRVHDRADLCAKLEALAAGEPADGVATGRSNPKQPPRPVFVLGRQAPFTVAELDELGRRFPAWREARDTLQAELGAPGLGDAALQPFGVQVLLGRVALAMGLRPAAWIGEGAGALAAACLSGRLTPAAALGLLRGAPAEAPGGADGAAAVPATGPLLLPGRLVEAREALAPALVAERAGAGLSEADLALLPRGDHVFLHLGGDAALRGRLAVRADAAHWLDLAAVLPAVERWLDFAGRLYLQGLRFDPRLLAEPGLRRVVLPTYPFENKPYRFSPVPLADEGPAAPAVTAATATTVATAAPAASAAAPAAATAPVSAAPEGLRPIRVPAPPPRLLPAGGDTLSGEQRRHAHAALQSALAALPRA